MSNQEDDNYVSVGGWMLMMLVMTIPVVNVIMLFVWAFAGNNQTRKNYFRAILLWMVLLIGLVMLLSVVGQMPGIKKRIQDWTQPA